MIFIIWLEAVIDFNVSLVFFNYNIPLCTRCLGMAARGVYDHVGRVVRRAMNLKIVLCARFVKGNCF